MVAEPPAKPLTGCVVVITRPRAQAAALADPLSALGAEVLVAPTIRIAPTALNDQIRAAVRTVGQYDLVVFTSANAVREFIARLLAEVAERRLPPIEPADEPATAEA